MYSHIGKRPNFGNSPLFDRNRRFTSDLYLCEFMRRFLFVEFLMWCFSTFSVSDGSQCLVMFSSKSILPVFHILQTNFYFPPLRVFVFTYGRMDCWVKSFRPDLTVVAVIVLWYIFILKLQSESSANMFHISGSLCSISLGVYKTTIL